MNAREFTSRLERIFRENSPEEICRYIHTYALTNPFLGYVIMDRFGRFETNDARSRVLQCFVSPLTNPGFHISALDWEQIDRNLGEVMAYARAQQAQGNDLQAVAIARYVILVTYQEYRDDHPSQKAQPEHTDYHTGEALQLLRDILIEGTTLPLAQRQEILLDFVGETSRIQRKNWFCPLTEFLKDARAVIKPRPAPPPDVGVGHRKVPIHTPSEIVNQNVKPIRHTHERDASAIH